MDEDVEPVIVVELDVNELVEVDELGPYGAVDDTDEPVDVVDELGPYGVVDEVEDPVDVLELEEPTEELELDVLEAVELEDPVVDEDPVMLDVEEAVVELVDGVLDDNEPEVESVLEVDEVAVDVLEETVLDE